jgi:uncharacterized protein YidB (DUF937 family)
MGLLDEILRGALGGGGLGGSLGGALGQQQRPTHQGSGNMSSILMALLPVVLGMLANRGNAPQAGSGQGQVGGSLSDLIGGMLGGSAAGGAGGLGDLLQRFQQAGYGDQAQSWVSTGQNQPISPDVIGQIFGTGGLSQIARQAGVSEQDASAGLSQLLPDVVDHFTPGGQVPDLDQLSASVEALARQFRG